MRKLIFTGLSIAASVYTLHAQEIEKPAFLSDDYRLVFNDEFNDPNTKNALWTPDDRDGRGEEWSGEYGVIEDGVMKLICKKYPEGSARVYSGPTCKSKTYFKYGYFECSYKYARNKGINNSFWLLGENSPLDADYMEIDINEGQVDDGGSRSPSSYEEQGAQPDWDHIRPLVLDHTSGIESSPCYIYTPTDLSADFHTYGFLWTADSLKFYVDRKEVLACKNETRFKVSHKGLPEEFRLLNYPMRIFLSVLTTPKDATYEEDDAMLIDYVRVYQTPSTCGQPPTEGDNLLKNGSFDPYDEADYGNGLDYHWSALGNVRSGYLSTPLSEARTSPIYMPTQVINIPESGLYEISFRARIIDAAGGANIRMKISDDTNWGTSILSGVACVKGGGEVSGSEAVITSAKNGGQWKDYTYYARLTKKEAPTRCRVMFYSSNSNGAATFEYDDIVFRAIEDPSENPNFLIYDGGVELDLINSSQPVRSQPTWSAMYSWQGHSTEVAEEEGNRFLRKTVINSSNAYQLNVSQYTANPLAADTYRLKLRARSAAKGAFALNISAAGNLGTTSVTAFSNLGNEGDTEFKSNLIYFNTDTEWRHYECTFKLADHAVNDYQRIYFRYPTAGTYDFDDVQLTPYSATSVQETVIASTLRVEGNTLHLNASKDGEYRIFNLQGGMLHTGSMQEEVRLTLEAGYYLIRYGSPQNMKNEKILIVR